jgi:hypothetical protein
MTNDHRGGAHFWMSIVLGLAAPAACGQVTSTSSSVSAVKACTDLAQALCAKRAACTSGTGILRANGDMNTCVSREELTCTIALAAPATGNNPDLVETCVTAYATYSCTDFLNGNPPSACVPAGPRPNDAACTFNGQCASAYCARDKNSTCGACAAAPAPGDSCVSSNCGHDQICVDSTMTCSQFGDINSACSTDAPCGVGLTCVGATASVAGSCQVAIAIAGQSCGGQGGSGCDVSLGLYCGGTTGAKTCMTMTYGANGAPCGLMADGTRAGCKAGACFTATGIAAASDAGTCKADAADGAACDLQIGPQCAAPARCVASGAGTAGTCTVPDATTCG